jgi:hypothetical protein
MPGRNNISVTNAPVLDKIIKGYMPGDQQFIHSELFPTIKVTSRTGDIKSAGTEFLRVGSKLIVGRAKTPEITVSLSHASGWACKKNGAKIMILQEDGEQFNQQDYMAGMSDARTMYAKMVKTNLMIAREKEAADSLTSTGVITNNVTLSGSDQWSDEANSDPVAVFKEARSTVRSACGREPNIAYMGWEVAETLRFHPRLMQMLNVSSDTAKLDGLDDKQLARVLKVNKVLIGSVQYESAAEGQTSSMANIWGKDFGMLYVNPNPTPEVFEFSFGYNFQLEDIVTDYWDVKDPKNAQFVRSQYDRDQLILKATAGFLVKSAVA